MAFADFHGNPEVVRQLREMLARDRFPHAVILAGPQGAGKYTLALMLARTMNCLQLRQTDGLPEYCGVCSNCERIGQSADLDARFAEAVEARENLRDTDKRETRILIQTHPDVIVVPPDPPQMMIKVDQVRHVIQSTHFKPGEAPKRVFIFTDGAFMKEAANSLLKILEEPPEFVHIFLLARNPGELLATVRSRCVTFTLAQLPVEEIEQYLAKHRPEWNTRQRQLAARLSGGAIGRARGLNLEEYIAARKDALAMLNSAIHPGDHSALFRATETYRAGADGKEKTDQLMGALYSLLKDMLALISGTPDLVRNVDITAELKSMASGVTFPWIAQASQQLGQVQSGMRRNVLRSLSLDALALSLEP
ncbi:MAG TPA: DNA polymerase III subunit delta' [Verrucomicrobiae bacterium]|jgi:DNA polymerase-3 subunit delta'|nr:DNA polymerase III subunit delta' [Verrucomicrobiae bacterium]